MSDLKVSPKCISDLHEWDFDTDPTLRRRELQNTVQLICILMSVVKNGYIFLFDYLFKKQKNILHHFLLKLTGHVTTYFMSADM